MDTQTTIAVCGAGGTVIATVAAISWRLGVLSARITSNTDDIKRHKETSDKRFDDAETDMVAMDKRIHDHEVKDAKTTTLLEGLTKQLNELKEKLDNVGGMIVEFIQGQAKKD